MYKIKKFLACAHLLEKINSTKKCYGDGTPVK